MHEDLSVLRGILQRHLTGPRLDTVIPGLALHGATRPTAPSRGLYQPAMCLVLQGAKLVSIGDRTMRYDPASYFVASVELPARGCISEASPEHPYLAVSMTLDRTVLSDLLCDTPSLARAESGGTAGFGVNAVTPGLLGAMGRLLGLLDTPDDVPVLAPLIKREILFRLLQNDEGGLLRQIARSDSRLSRIHRAIGWIRAHFDAPLEIDHLAALAGMSRASFHRHFKAATAMSPLQFQKSLRLQEARRLLLSETDAQHTAFRVGYQSSSQFSREYARMFGLPPVRDVERLRDPSAAGEIQPATI
ncbi:AraC family transcriptional regulator [Consotaella aegiceratis]|uniref:AraC family transcriptional regulator n=1 Tax=Consotaella aegiceratis TaxID=3097961 RepID=UPI002F40AFAF